jgi:hypothetical protein
MRPLPVMLLLLAVGGCAPEAAPPMHLGRARLPIAGGYEDPDDTAVVAVFHVPSQSLCSGTLIAKNLVLTARHCVSLVSGGPTVDCSESAVGAPFDAAGFLVTTATTVDAGSVGEHFVAQVIVPADGDDRLCGRDVAALVLEEAVDAARAEPLELRLDEELVVDDLYSAIGYGATDDLGNGAGVRRRRDDLQVICLGAGCDMTEVFASEWVGSGGVCSGDSGGPALDATSRVVGVTSRGEKGCGLTIYGSTVSWSDWIRDAGVCAAGAGLYPPPGWTAGSSAKPEACMPIGDGCSAPADCATGLCLDGSYCTRPCSDGEPCPDDYSCELRGDETLCVRDEVVNLAPIAHVERETNCGLGAGAPRPRGWLALASALAAFGLRRRRREVRNYPTAVNLSFR